MPSPKISLNKLGEYLTATPARRKRIVQDQEDPKPFIVARYSDAREAIVDFLASGMTEEKKLLSQAKKLRFDDSGTAFSYQDKLASAEAIESFAEAADQIDLEDLKVVPVENSSSHNMEISGVNVSIRPDAYLKDPITGDTVGAIKLHFPKTTPLNDDALGYVATALRVHLNDAKDAKVVDHKKCYVVDVSTRTVAHAPKAFTKKMNDIAAAREEIEARWKRNQVSDAT